MAKSPWTQLHGRWTRYSRKLVQKNLLDITRCYQKFNYQNFTANFCFRLTDTAENENGETKFIYSNAHIKDKDRGENFRVDFAYGLNLCRIMAGNLQANSILQLTKNRVHKVRIRVKDNLISVEVDGLSIFSSFNFGKRSDGSVGFGTWCSAAEFAELDVQPFEVKNCFIIMPFDEKRNFLYEQVIKPVLLQHASFDFQFVRADESLTVGKISEEISDFIRDSDVIIADITEDNRNVFYELGYAHAVGKKAVLLIERQEGKRLDLPFDIQDFRCHEYRFSHEGFRIIRDRIAGVLTRIY